jgi:hypothetical protein
VEVCCFFMEAMRLASLLYIILLDSSIKGKTPIGESL